MRSKKLKYRWHGWAARYGRGLMHMFPPYDGVAMFKTKAELMRTIRQGGVPTPVVVTLEEE